MQQSKGLLELAQLALETLRAQRTYFRNRRSEDLVHSKVLEKKLCKLAQAVLDDATVSQVPAGSGGTGSGPV